MKTASDLLHRTPWWAVFAFGLALLVGLAVLVTPFHLIGLEHAGATPEEQRAIKHEVESTFSEGAINMAHGIVLELRKRTRDPARREELDRALEEIEQAREGVRDAGREAREAARSAANAVREARDAATPEVPAPPASPPVASADRARNIIVSPGHVEIDIDNRNPLAVPIAPLPPQMREQIRSDIASDLYRMGVGGALILVLIPLFILAGVSKIFIDRSRAAQRMAEGERREAEYQRMSRQVTEAKLSALQAQVEPHFLYNTLASVQALTEVDPARANAMTGHLIQYLRNALPKMRESVSTVGQEVELVRAYLNILQMRMGTRLAFEISVEPGLESAPFPPLMLPSLVENAIKHGLEPQREGGTVTIRAEALDGRIRVSVADTGRGISESPGQGVGLANIRERLAALYGDAGRLAIEAKGAHGVLATLEVPRTVPAGAGIAPPPPPPPPPKGKAARTLAAMGSAERAWRKGLSFAFVVLVTVAAVFAGLAIVGIMTGLLHVRVGDAMIDGAPGAFLGAAGVTFAFVAMVIALAVVLAVVYGLGFLFLGLAIFVPLAILVSLFPVLAPFILAGLIVWWLVRRAARKP